MPETTVSARGRGPGVQAGVEAGVDGHQALRACMLGITLLNLAFVHITGVASWHWLGPLYVLTAAAPLLDRHREALAYRLLWNGGVVCFFVLLIGHVLDADLGNVLEDGLVLAVLCQVHLLNNLRITQRQDLFFLHAFLIATMTGFLSRGVGFGVAFLAFVPVYVIGLELRTALRPRGGRARTLGAGATRMLLRDGVRRAGWILAVSAAVFLFWPRDFERRALFQGRFELPSTGGGDLEIGFNERLQLGRDGAVSTSDRPTLRVRLMAGSTQQVPTLWRGATLGATKGGDWEPLAPAARRTSGGRDERWKRRGSGLVRSGWRDEPLLELEVVRLADDTERLFAPLGTRRLQLGDEHVDAVLRGAIDGTIEVSERGDVDYRVLVRSAETPRGGGIAAQPEDPLAIFVELPEDVQTDRARTLAEDLAAGLAEDIEQHLLVEHFAQWLERSYAYVAPGEQGAAEHLDAFLAGTGGGHCEFFASALATMLRSRGVPCRVVTGYRSSRWSERGEAWELAFGARDAHAWVEVHDPEGGWYAVDPSPQLAERQDEAGTLAWLRERARAGWTAITRFDAERRAALFAWVRGLPARLLGWARVHPLRAGGVLALLGILGGALLRRRRARTPAPVRTYRRALRRAGLALDAGETPREALARAERMDVPRERLEALEQATREHEAYRYAA